MTEPCPRSRGNFKRIRLEAAEQFVAGVSKAEVAKDLRASVRSVQRWRRAWHDAGAEGLRSAGPVCVPKLSEALFAVLEQELAKGPVAHGWPDQTWTLARVKMKRSGFDRVVCPGSIGVGLLDN
ncbi:helix-turn-helix domain-containing protein [Streptomyces sp. NPDC001027]|uniref:helix-turn-helix domain-containing protein n=1 Tax=Streptomyces sp. NPDC001027 TaxID=3154771 RepID=UPI003318F51A